VADEDVFRPNGEYTFKREFGRIAIKPVEYHCMNCTKSWVIDKDGNEYNVSKNSENAIKDAAMYSEPDLGNKLKFSDFYKNAKETATLLGPNSGKLLKKNPEYSQILPATEQEQYKDYPQTVLTEKKKIKLQKKYNINYVDGEFFAVQKTIKPKFKQTKIKESMYLDSVKKLDEKFNFNGRLVRMVEKNENCSELEQKMSNFLSEFDNGDFSDMVEYMSESFPEETEYLKVIKKSILCTNEEVIDINDKIRRLEEMKKKAQTRINEINNRINELRSNRTGTNTIK
jgi:hypothetical protein